MPANWGQHFIVPSKNLVNLSGRVLLRESFDDELLKKDLTELGFSGIPFRAVNPWYFRKKENWSLDKNRRVFGPRQLLFSPPGHNGH